MRVFKVSDGTSWQARLQEPGAEAGSSASTAAWEAILFQPGRNTDVDRLVYRPAGWLAAASQEDLAAALEEGVRVRVRWGG
jgi:hypothetical protein